MTDRAPAPATAASIWHKLTTMTLLASGTALLTATAAFTWYDWTTFQDRLEETLTIQAQMVASNSASALTFDDATAAASTLGALRFAPNIVSAAILTTAGQPLATYYRDEDHEAGRRDRADPLFTANRLRVTREVAFENRALGSVAIESDLSDLAERQAAYVRIGGWILLASLAAAVVMSRISQRSIARPIVELARLSEAIAIDQDYSRRASDTRSVHEVRTLVRTFNTMLEEIEEKNRSLQRAHEELEDRVRVRTAELDAANRELEAFSYSVSHDLRAPLRHITGFSELLAARAGAQLDEQARRYLGTITTAAARMAHLIDDLLAFSRIARTALAREPVDLNRLVAEARDEITAQVPPGRDIEWRIGPLPTVNGDRSMLNLVMINLLSNAVKYSSTRPRSVIEIGSAAASGSEVAVFVRDNGVGFDMQYADKLFGVFQRLHRADQFEGTGVGLAHIKRIITRHGGRVWAEGRVDQGATFSFSLPLREGRT
jgi:signal transduction histidine kinase